MFTPEELPLERIWTLATENGGSITSDELTCAGLSPDQIRALVAKGFLRRVRRGHYLVGHGALSRSSVWTFTTRQAGDDSFLAGAAALDSWGVLPWPSRDVEIVVPRRRRPVTGALVRVRPKLVDGGGVLHGRTPVLDLGPAIVSFAERASPTTVVRLIREAALKHQLDIARLDRLANTRYMRGGPTVRLALELREQGDAGLWSRYERMAQRALPADVLEGSVRNYDVPVPGGLINVDRVWIELGVCLEVDGPPHDDPAQARIDRIKRASLRTIGHSVHEVHWRDLERDPVAAVARVVEDVRTRRLRQLR